jgi:hypothetical protein
MKPTTKQIAAACNRPYTTVKKWPLQRRERLAALIQKGGCPLVADLIAEVQSLCYEASIKLGVTVTFTYHILPNGFGSFQIYYYDDSITTRADVMNITVLNEEGLQFAAAMLEKIINAK